MTTQGLEKPKRKRSGWDVFRWRTLTGSDPPEQPLCPVCARPVYESEEVRRPLFRRRPPAAPAARTCAACGTDLKELFAQLKKLRRLRQSLRGLWRALLGSLAALLLCLAAALLIFALKARPLNVERLWFDTALDILGDLTKLLLIVAVLLKGAFTFLDQHIDRVAAGD